MNDFPKSTNLFNSRFIDSIASLCDASEPDIVVKVVANWCQEKAAHLIAKQGFNDGDAEILRLRKLANKLTIALEMGDN